MYLQSCRQFENSYLISILKWLVCSILHFTRFTARNLRNCNVLGASNEKFRLIQYLFGGGHFTYLRFSASVKECTQILVTETWLKIFTVREY